MRKSNGSNTTSSRPMPRPKNITGTSSGVSRRGTGLGTGRVGQRTK